MGASAPTTDRAPPAAPRARVILGGGIFCPTCGEVTTNPGYQRSDRLSAVPSAVGTDTGHAATRIRTRTVGRTRDRAPAHGWR